MTTTPAPTGLSVSAAAAAVEQQLRAQRVLAILRLRDHSRAVELCQALADGGITVMEITVDHPDSLRSLERARHSLDPSVALGAGTVLDAATVAQVAAAGASFCVSPHLDAAIVAAARDRGLLPIPGVLSPTEVIAAHRMGLSLLKLFPAGPAGVDYLRVLRGPLPHIGFVPTGGIEVDDVPQWLAAGAVAVALGGGLVGNGADVHGLKARLDHLARLLHSAG